jgi:hypothetical protein
MTEDHAKSWMKQLAAGGLSAQLPDFDRLWAMRRLEEEFERRRRMTAPLDWLDFAMQSAAGLACAALLAWWGSLS